MMKTLTAIAFAGGALLAAPALAQNFDPQQALHGLLNGNQNQNQAVQQAYERGYRDGRRDEARRADRGNGGSSPQETQEYGGNRPTGSDSRGYGNDTNYPAGSYNRNRGD